MLEKSIKTTQATKGGIGMSEQYAIVPFVAQAELVHRAKEFEPGMLAEQYGSHLLRFLSPLAQELYPRMDIRPLRTARWCRPSRRSSPFGTALTGSCSPNWAAIWTAWAEEEGPNGWGP